METVECNPELSGNGDPRDEGAFLESDVGPLDVASPIGTSRSSDGMAMLQQSTPESLA